MKKNISPMVCSILFTVYLIMVVSPTPLSAGSLSYVEGMPSKQTLQRMRELDPNNYVVSYYLGMLHYNQGHLHQALLYLKQAAAGGLTQADQLLTRLKHQLTVEEQ